MDLATYAVLNKKIDAIGNIPDEKITEAVNTYLDENPPTTGATAEQAAQINKNVADIDELKGDLENEERRAKQRENEIEALFTMPVLEQVDKWLDEHPEATTTVQDNSLTVDKMVIGTLGYVTPEMFGAVGDGVTNDTEALRQTFNHGGIVLLKNRYLITSEISMTNDCIIISDTNGELLFNSFGALFKLERPVVLYKVKATSLNDESVSENVSVNFCESNNKQVIAYNCDINNFRTAFGSVGDNSIISGCNIVLKEVVNETNNAFYGIHGECSNSSYINNIIKNGRHSIYLSGKCENVRVIGNTCMNSKWQNIHIYSTSNTRKSKDCIIADNTVINNGSNECIVVIGYSENILITNNICTNTGSGYCIKTEGADNTISLDVFIKSNILRGKNGIYIHYSKGVIVSENDIKVDSSPIFCETHSNNIVCNGNITQSLEDSIHYVFVNVNNIEVYNNILEGLTIDKYYVDDYTSCGLRLENVESCKIFDNKVNEYNVYSIKHPTANVWYTLKESILFDETNDPPQIWHNAGDIYKYTHSSTKYLTKCISRGTPGTFVTISL